MKVRIAIDVQNAAAGLRTTGALLLGNAFIAYMLDGAPRAGWWQLALAGFILLALTSFKRRSK